MNGDVELPVRRRHRALAAPSGLLLFVCLFLPAVQHCGRVAYPYQIPIACPPYLLGLGVAITALWPRPVTAATIDGARILAGLGVALWTGWTLCFALLALDGSALIGVALAAWASAWLLVAAVVRLRDLRTAAAWPLPQARVGKLRLRSPMSAWRLAVLMAVTFAAAAAARSGPTQPSCDSDAGVMDRAGC